jgi:two-component system chemotaxis response regulator CheY
MGSNYRKIMIIDDSTHVRESLAFYLKKMGYEVIETANSRTALNLITGNNIGLFIIDIDMQEMDGVTFFKEINENEDTSKIPIIMVSTENRYNIIEEMSSTGTKSWMISPYQPARLFATVKQLMTVY